MTITTAPIFSVIISSYNYQEYVVDAVESALAQTFAASEIIVVDDGSTDESLQRLRTRFGQDARVHILEQANAGQLAAWMTGFNHSTGDYIALLDSDDLWQPDFLQAIAHTIAKTPSADFIYCNLSLFGAREGVMLNRAWHRHDRDLGTSVLLGCFNPRWQGVATSGNVIKRALLAKLFTLPKEDINEWRTRPDDCLFYGSDILGAHKVYLAQPLGCHREHAHNALLLDKAPLRRMRYELRRERMLSHYRAMAQASPRLLTLAKTEFRTKSQPTTTEWWLYCCMALKAPQPWLRRIGQILAITRHFLAFSRTQKR